MKFLAETFFCTGCIVSKLECVFFFSDNTISQLVFPSEGQPTPHRFQIFLKKRRNFNSFENGIQKSEWKFNGLCDFDFFKLYVCLFVIEKIYTVLTRLTLRLWRTWKCVLLRSNKVGPSLSTIILTIWLSSKLALVF